MKKISTIAAILLFLTQLTNAQGNPAASLEGTWIIDLTPTPGAQPYLQEMAIDQADGKGLSGWFYGSQFSNGETNSLWGKTCFAFTTKDGSSIYFSSGYIEDGALKGMTYCDKRDFVMPWTGKRKEEITK